MSLFDDAWSTVLPSTLSVLGETVTINGFLTTAEVSTVTSTTRRKPGLRVQDNSTIIHLSRDEAERCNAIKGKLVTVKTATFRITSSADLGGAGIELTCEAVDQVQKTPGL